MQKKIKVLLFSLIALFFLATSPIYFKNITHTQVFADSMTVTIENKAPIYDTAHLYTNITNITGRSSDCYRWQLKRRSDNTEVRSDNVQFPLTQTSARIDIGLANGLSGVYFVNIKTNCSPGNLFAEDHPSGDFTILHDPNACYWCPLDTSYNNPSIRKSQTSDQIQILNCDVTGQNLYNLALSQPIDICYYSPKSGSGISKCVLVGTDSCTSTKPNCSPTIGCYGSGADPATCSLVEGGKITNCNRDSICTTTGESACTGYHCLTETGYIIVPEYYGTGISGSCQYKPGATTDPGIDPSKACLTCSSGCTANDASGNPYCLSSCTGGTKVDPTNTTYCNSLLGETCKQGTGCEGGTIPVSTPVPTTSQTQFTNDPFGGAVGAYGCGSDKNDIWTLKCVFPMLANVIFWLMSFSGVVAVIFIIIGGMMFVMANGDPKNVTNAKRTIEFALVGLIVIFLTFFILGFIATTTGVVCLDPNRTLSFTSCAP